MIKLQIYIYALVLDIVNEESDEAVRTNLCPITTIVEH